MGDIRQWLQKISDKVSSASVLGQPSQPEFLEIMEYQRHSLVKQHELLGVIVLYLVKADHSVVGDFELLLGILKKADKYDNLLGKHSLVLALVPSLPPNIFISTVARFSTNKRMQCIIFQLWPLTYGALGLQKAGQQYKMLELWIRRST